MAEPITSSIGKRGKTTAQLRKVLPPQGFAGPKGSKLPGVLYRKELGEA